MTHFIESDRLFFKGVEVTDVTQKYVDWMNDPEVSQYMETWQFLHTRANIEEYVRKHTDNRNEPFFAIMLPNQKIDTTGNLVWDNPTHIGNIKLGPINWIHRYADVSLFIGEKKLRGNGFGTEAIKMLTEYAFKRLNLHKLRAGIYAMNQPSVHAFKKAGFQLEGELRDHVWFNGEWRYVYLMGKVNE